MMFDNIFYKLNEKKSNKEIEKLKEKLLQCEDDQELREIQFRIQMLKTFSFKDYKTMFK